MATRRGSQPSSRSDRFGNTYFSRSNPTVKDPSVHSGVSMTSLSLLDRARASDPVAWDDVVRLYRPLVYYWCRRQVDETTAEDIAQEVFAAVFRKLDSFHHNGRKGAFRAWLRTITLRLLIDLHRQRQANLDAVGGSTANGAMQRLPDGSYIDPSLEPTEHELSQEVSLLYHRAWELIRHEFSTRDNDIFKRVIENGETPANVGADLGVGNGLVSVVVSRIKKKVRERFQDF